MITIFWS